MSADLRIGTQIGDYRIESLLGRGGMSVVYLAEHVRLKRKAALKVLSPELAEDPTFRQRFADPNVEVEPSTPGRSSVAPRSPTTRRRRSARSRSSRSSR